jgi:hypothetical protein
MSNRLRRQLVVLAVPAAMLFTACGTSHPTTTTMVATSVAGSSGAQVIGPVMVDQATLDGRTVETRLGRIVVFAAPNPTKWTATVADPSIATFTPGRSDGSAVYNPSLAPLASGTTKVTITDGTTTATFTLVVS